MRFALLGSVAMGLFLFACDNGTTPGAGNSGGKASVTISYHVGTLDASSATIEVDGGFFTTVQKNSEKVITVDNGAALSASWSVRDLSGTYRNRSSSQTASNGLKWSL